MCELMDVPAIGKAIDDIHIRRNTMTVLEENIEAFIVNTKKLDPDKTPVGMALFRAIDYLEKLLKEYKQCNTVLDGYVAEEKERACSINITPILPITDESNDWISLVVRKDLRTNIPLLERTLDYLVARHMVNVLGGDV